MPRKIFLDASTIFPAANSATGASRELIRKGSRGEIQIPVSQDVLMGVERNFSRKAPQIPPHYNSLLAHFDPEIVSDPSKQQIWAAEKHIAQKDTPIVAAAKRAKPDLLVTLDRKHLLGRPEFARYVGSPVVTPAQALDSLRRDK